MAGGPPSKPTSSAATPLSFLAYRQPAAMSASLTAFTTTSLTAASRPYVLRSDGRARNCPQVIPRTRPSGFNRHDGQVEGLSAADLILLAVGALLVGFAKTSIGGVASISVALFAAVLPARESTGALLPLLIAGDLFALQAYRAHAQWARLLRLFPSVALGVVAGAVFVSFVDDVVMRRTIGAVLLGLVLLTLWRRRPGRSEKGAADGAADAAGRTWPAALGYGSLAGFTTMVANAAGAVMSLYLLTARLDKLAFLGTAAWFFFLVNVFKVPFSIGLGLLTVDSLKLNAVLVPAVLVGALVGRVVIRRVNQELFERLVLVFTALSSVNLLR